MSMDRQIAFKISAERLLELGIEAEKRGQTIAGYVRQLVYEKLDEAKAE